MSVMFYVYVLSNNNKYMFIIFIFNNVSYLYIITIDLWLFDFYNILCGYLFVNKCLFDIWLYVYVPFVLRTKSIMKN